MARQWNEQLLDAKRKDFVRPTVHARNLFHTSVLMYDAWAIFEETGKIALPNFFIRNYCSNDLQLFYS